MTCSELFDLGNITVAIKMPLRCCAAVGDSTARSSAVCIVHGRSRIALKTQPRCVKVHVFKCNFLTCKELTFRVVHPIFFFKTGAICTDLTFIDACYPHSRNQNNSLFARKWKRSWPLKSRDIKVFRSPIPKYFFQLNIKNDICQLYK